MFVYTRTSVKGKFAPGNSRRSRSGQGRARTPLRAAAGRGLPALPRQSSHGSIPTTRDRADKELPSQETATQKGEMALRSGAMAPTTHLLASWIVAAKTTDNLRDCRLVALAGILPDVDGLGYVADLYNRVFKNKVTDYYQQYHHIWMHGGLGALAVTAVLVCFARRRGRVAILSLLVYHLHLLCDLIGSRGPDPTDRWPIYYLAPLTLHSSWLRTHSVWSWKYQWQLFGWQNGVISIALFVWAMALAIQRGDSIIGVFNRRADAVFVGKLREWRDACRVLFGKRE